MKKYRIRLIQQGPMTEIPNSLAVFGAICHGFKALYGKNKLESFLERIDKAEEMFAVSSVFLGDTLPFPLDIEPPRVDLSALDKEAFAKFKKIKKIKFISKSLFETYKNDLEKFNQSFYHHILNGVYIFHEKHQLLCHQHENSFFESIKIKNHVATRNKWSLNDEEKSLFYTTRIVYSKDAPFDLYMFAEDDRAVEIKKMLEKLDYFTLGGKQSIGMNLFRYISMDEVKTFNSKSLLLISKALVIPTEIDFDQSMYRINQLSSIFDNSVKIKRFRKPIIVFEEGSVFKDDKMTMGGLVKDEVANRVIYQNAIGMLI